MTPLTVRWLKPGEVFVLLRSGELYEYIKQDINTPGGIKHWVRRVLEKKYTTLHHSCHVRVVAVGEKT